MAVEVAMALVLLVGAGLLTRSFTRLLHVDPGVNTAGVAVGWLGLPSKKYPDENSQRVAFNEILRRAQSVPGVTHAALTSALPLSGTMQNKITFEGHPNPKGQEPLIQVQMITADYFRTMGIRLLMGRQFGPTDGQGGARVVWIDEALAKRYLPGENPIGKWLVHGGVDSKEPKQLIAGVVNQVHDSGLDSRATGIIYIPFDRSPQSWMSLVVKSALPLEETMPALRREIASFDKQLPLSNQQSLAEIVDGSVGQERFTMFVLGIFAVVALMLAAVGVYGVIGYLVAQRSHEFGIRMALGAQRASIVGLVTRRVLVISGAGVIVGLGTASIASGVMTKLLYDTQPMDVATYAGAALALLLVAMIAALVPTMRATRVSPAATMRSE